MNKNFLRFFGFILIFTFLVIGSARVAQAEVSFSINIGSSPRMIMIPDTDVYFVEGVDYDVFFYGGYWWYPRGGYWYRAREYNGPWGRVRRNYVPAHLFRVPRNYREVYRNERPINYGQWRKQYRDHGDRGGYEGHGRGRH